MCSFLSLTCLAFYLRPSSDGVKHNSLILLSHRGSDATPEYTLRHPDPSLPASKNRYAAALYDSYNPEILFGEVLLIPKWTQPNATQEDIRLNGGIPPPPQPVLPAEFTIQLYNPDQQVVYRSKPGSWNSAPCWEFEMPQQSFRQPSNSTLDRTKSDPTASEITPKLTFKWKKDGKLSKDYVCALAGKSTNPDGSKRKHREPDITVALFRHLKEMTMYEPNFSRVEMEDPKGLEVVLLLGAIVIREVFNRQVKDAFNIADPPLRESYENASPQNTEDPGISTNSSTPPIPPVSQGPQLPIRGQISRSRPPPTDPRTQWELDAEEARLKHQIAQEKRERKRAEEAEIKRLKKMVAAEERAVRKKKEMEVEQETERLRRIYGIEGHQQSDNSSMPPRQSHQRNSVSISQHAVSRPRSAAAWTPTQISHSPHLVRSPSFQPLRYGSHFSTSFSSLPGASSTNPTTDGMKIKPKKSFWGIRSVSHEQPLRLRKKQSMSW